MRPLVVVLLLAACTQPSNGINWYRYTEFLHVQGDLRTDRKPSDAPVTRKTLVENFRRIAFDREEYPLGDKASLHQSPMHPFLRKWHAPMRYDLYTEPDDRSRLLHLVEPFMLRLVRITGHPIPRRSNQPGPDEKARLIVVYGPDRMFAGFRETVRNRNPDEDGGAFLGLVADFLEAFRLAPSPCAGQVFRAGNSESEPVDLGTITAAIVAIKREIPDEMLASCVEEELAQVMGLINDHPEARPSIFNDDQEFALLTEHDEHLLRILYDDRLEPGMSVERAMPVVERIVAELLPED